ncbi:MAG: hypothetical protein L6Q78_02630 [Bacteroidia bacterium]|nr:hypothetical protein [Bacteroidia bacterium]
MKTLFIPLLLLLLVSKNQVCGQVPDDCYKERDFLILFSSKSYASALQAAKAASAKSGLALDLRGLNPVKDTNLGLSFHPDSCKLYYPESLHSNTGNCYLPRGEWEDERYISIEYSSGYLSFRKGYYIVMAGSGPKNDLKLKELLDRVKLTIKDAYIKTSKVFICCME